jgi:DNA polymerase
VSDDAGRPPPPLDEARRRAYLAAMGIPLWLPRRQAGDAGATEPSAAPEPMAAPRAPAAPGDAVPATEAPAPAGDDEPPPMPAELADEAAARVEAEGPEPAADRGEGGAGAGVAGMDWEPLRQTILGCRACELCQTRTQAVPGVGATTADLLVIGEAPGQEEDRQGEPFVGRAGQLLDRMLAAIGHDRTSVFITNVLKCRPPKNRDPKPDEIRACAPYLRRQIELMAPRAILSVGRVSAQSLLETGDAIGRLRGRWHTFGPQSTPLWVTYHPAYLLRNPAAKGKVWSDLKAVREQLRA